MNLDHCLRLCNAAFILGSHYAPVDSNLHSSWKTVLNALQFGVCECLHNARKVFQILQWLRRFFCLDISAVTLPDKSFMGVLNQLVMRLGRIPSGEDVLGVLGVMNNTALILNHEMK